MAISRAGGKTRVDLQQLQIDIEKQYLGWTPCDDRPKWPRLPGSTAGAGFPLCGIDTAAVPGIRQGAGTQ